jgi:hypothetical protein
VDFVLRSEISVSLWRRSTPPDLRVVLLRPYAAGVNGPALKVLERYSLEEQSCYATVLMRHVENDFPMGIFLGTMQRIFLRTDSGLLFSSVGAVLVP